MLFIWQWLWSRLRSAELVRILAPTRRCGRRDTPELACRVCPILYATLRVLGSAMPAQLTPTVYRHIESIVRSRRRKSTDALVKRSRARMRRGVELCFAFRRFPLLRGLDAPARHRHIARATSYLHTCLYPGCTTLAPI